MKKRELFLLISTAVVAGFIAGMIMFLLKVIANQYFQQGMYRLILRSARLLLTADVLFFVLLSLILVLPAMVRSRRNKEDSRPGGFATAAAVIVTVLAFADWLLRSLTTYRIYTLPWMIFTVSGAREAGLLRAARAYVMLTLKYNYFNLIVLFGAIAASALLYRLITRVKREKMLKIVPGKAVMGTAGVAVAILVLLNLSAAVERMGSVPRGPNVVLIYMDALRPDHLSGYGYGRKTSPNIDKMAQAGALFRNAISQGPGTFPSVHATLTSKYASNFFNTRKCRLEENHLTLAEILQENGYYTVAFSSSPIITRRETGYSLGGFDQGFEAFDDSLYQGREDYNWQHRNPEGVINGALAWLNKNYRRRFFLFLYIMDPHCKYNPPEPFKSLYDPDYRGGKEMVIIGHPTPYEVRIIRGEKTDLNERDIEHLAALYDGEIRYADSQIGKLLRRLQELGLEKETLIVLTADHGEEFFEHGGVKHCYTLYNELIKVPIIMRYPPLIPGGTAVTEIVQAIDIVPTILEIAGIKRPEVMEGASLLSLLKGEVSGWREWALSEAPFVDGKAIVTPKWKYIHHFETELVKPELCEKYSKGRELYNLENDPGERNNLYDARPEMVAQLYKQMINLLPEEERERIKAGKPIELDEETRERLKSLGYLQ